MPEAHDIFVNERPSSIRLQDAHAAPGAGIEGAGSQRTAAALTTDAHGGTRPRRRMRALLRASAAVAGELNLSILLRHIVIAARDLVDAGYAALAVTASDGSMDQWVHVGIDERTASEVDHLSRERGVLEMLIDRSDLYRLPDLHTPPGTAGCHGDIAPIVRFLAVPICVRNEVFATLYATESGHGGFTDEDEQLITSLACSAGVAVENARLYEQSEHSRRWQSASTDVTQQLFATDIERPLDIVPRFAALGADADFAMLTSLTDDDQLAIQATYGPCVEHLAGRTIDIAGSAIDSVFHSEKSALISHLADGPGTDGQGTDRQGTDRHGTDRHGTLASLVPGAGTLIAAPLLMNHRQTVVVIVGRSRERRALDMADVDQLSAFAGNVSVALQLDDARAEQEAARLRRDHDRIATDLSGQVVQGLLATGMGLQGLVHGLDRPEHQARVLEYVDAIDAVIRRIRTTIFDLHPVDRVSSGLKQRLLAVLDGERPALGFRTDLEFAGPLDSSIGEDLSEDVVAVVRMALSNVPGHAHEQDARISVSLAGQVLSIDVVDDGLGMSNRAWSRTMARERAERHGGALEVSALADGGTHLRWTAECAQSTSAASLSA